VGKSLYPCVCVVALLAGVALANPASPYAGQETREIKGLAPEDVEAYLSGKGMGLAKAAELNGYPGPAHVLALSSELQLTPDQKARTQSLFSSMEARAISLGRALITQEQQLDEQFASRTITRESLAALLRSIGELQSQVRDVHLEAHLAQLTILTPSQVAKYIELRGYTSATKHQGSHEHAH
jgi:Spy/CpxP family protein refolding chaperone